MIFKSNLVQVERLGRMTTMSELQVVADSLPIESVVRVARNEDGSANYRVIAPQETLDTLAQQFEVVEE